MAPTRSARWRRTEAARRGGARGGGGSRNVTRMSGFKNAAVDLWKRAEVVCFDVDSTVCSSEGIDDLGDYLGKGEAVAEFTAKAMTGTMPFEEALAARLDIIRPSSGEIDKFLESDAPKLTPGIAGLVAALQGKGKAVYLVSGGFRVMIDPVADELRIPRENVFANTLFFDQGTGSYTGFDDTEFTSRAGGKARAARHIKEITKATTLAMVGDGATDLEARQPGGADIFVGFGGIVKREAVLDQADWAVCDFEELTRALE
ncbi:phosphoserine phosphatase [Chloropicon primus]|uniref:phosphoserine phosphatase n=1 Tax=Chloropicon primus TaxID=1764295 RepID=A0A5B8MU03_9CHLO|nr:phosphoserine phosphatase [Chloropicon primus]UPR03009.1 phosphoserine phosphatase [Chloropicon primus]|eukprot:QDZ23796.1 phosphoserine phosphatase [Chloropicon primus]